MPEVITEEKPSRAAAIWENITGLAKVLAVVLLIKGCVIDQYSIPSPSMEPTLHGDPRFMRGDRVLVNKWIYGPRIPFTTYRLWDWRDPQRWDIAVFKPPPGASEHDILIKRIVALPGERVHIKEGKLFINGQEMPFPDSMPEGIEYLDNHDFLRIAVVADSPLVQQYAQGMLESAPKYGILEEDQYSLVPEDHYFMLGDNSLKSADGRIWGWVPRDNLYGRAFAVWWPWPRRQDFSGFSHTWWGQALLWGIPIGLVAWELHGWFRERQRRKARAGANTPK